MTTVYLHIGAPKTATSTVQSLLADNDSRLLSQGVLYPKSMRLGAAHHMLVCDLIDKYHKHPMPDIWYGSHPRGVAWDKLNEEINAQKKRPKSVIVSSELFIGQVVGIDKALRDMASHLDGFDVKVVVYLRRQDQLYSSFYNQDIKGVRQWRASAFEFYETHQMLRADYMELLRPWSKTFGKENIVLRPFDSAQWPNQSIVDEVSEAFGGLTLKSRSSAHENAGLGPVQLYLKRCLNRIGFDKEDNDAVLDILGKIIFEDPTGNCQFINPPMYRRYRHHWQKVNEQLSKQFLGGQPLFTSEIPPVKEVEFYKFDRFTLAIALHNLIELLAKKRYRKYRALFARAAFLAIAEEDMWEAVKKERYDRMLEWV